MRQNEARRATRRARDDRSRSIAIDARGRCGAIYSERGARALARALGGQRRARSRRAVVEDELIFVSIAI